MMNFEENIVVEESKETEDHPHVPVMPPKMALMALIIGLALDLLFDVDILTFWIQWPVGLVLFGGGVYLMQWAKRRLKAAHTPVSTAKPVTAIVKDGPYQYTRNPIYIGGAVGFLGLAILLDNIWMVLLWGLVLYILHSHVIPEEEKYLEGKFGDEYLSFKNTTPRWL